MTHRAEGEGRVQHGAVIRVGHSRGVWCHRMGSGALVLYLIVLCGHFVTEV